MRILFILGLFYSSILCAQRTFSTTQSPYTRDQIHYIETTVDLLGKPLSATFVPDGVIYVKQNGVIYRASSQQEGTFKAAWFGIKPGGDISAGFDRIKKVFPKSYPLTLTFEAGTYTSTKPIEFTELPVQLIGVGKPSWGNFVTTFNFPKSAGFVFRGCDGANIQNMMIIGGDKHLGLSISSVMTIRDVMVTHFDKGVEFWGDIENGNKRDASRSKIYNLTVSNCFAYGVRLIGGDANQCSFYDLDVRDIAGWGLMDQSFLGNTYYSAHFNNCRGGAVTVTDPNSIVSFYDCYMEDGQPPSKVTKSTSFFGARVFATQIEGGFVQRGTTANTLTVGGIMLQDGGLKLWNKYGGSWNLIPNKEGLWEFNYSNIHATKQYLLPPNTIWRKSKIESPSVGTEYPQKVVPLIK